MRSYAITTFSCNRRAVGPTATDQEIIELYGSGLTYDDIRAITGASSNRIEKLLKGTRSISEAAKIAVRKGRCAVANQSAEDNAKAAHKSIANSNRFWTKPEREFRKLLNECGLGVKFPPILASRLQECDDDNAQIWYQYPIQRYLCDFVYLEKSVIFRINGDYWHANKAIYTKQLTKQQLHNVRHDENAKVYFEKHGWIVLDIWESQIANHRSQVLQIIRAVREVVNPATLHVADLRFESETAYFKTPKPRKLKQIINVTCVCGRTIETKRVKQKYCSSWCSKFLQPTKIDWPDNLAELVDKSSALEMAKKLGVSDKAIAKRLKRKP